MQRERALCAGEVRVLLERTESTDDLRFNERSFRTLVHALYENKWYKMHDRELLNIEAILQCPIRPFAIQSFGNSMVFRSL